MPQVSVVIPAYNSEKYVGKAVSSALGQTLHDIEVIIVDDGSTDGTAALIGKYEDHRVIYVYQENQERSAARNHGMSIASGKYIAFLDADDWWLPTKLERQIALLESNVELGLVSCWIRPITLNGKSLPVLQGFMTAEQANGANIFERLLFGGLPGPGSTMVVRRSVCDEIGGFRSDLRYGEDWEFALRVAAHYLVGMVRSPLAYYRVYGSYMPRKLDQLGQQEAFPKIIISALDCAGIEFQSDLARKALSFASYYSALVDAGLQDYQSANERLAYARALDEASFSGRRPTVIVPIAHFANALYDSITPVDDSIEFIRGLFQHLPDTLADLRKAMRYTYSLTYAIRVFQGRDTAVKSSLRSAFIRSLIYDRDWLKNGGYLKLGVSNMLGRS